MKRKNGNEQKQELDQLEKKARSVEQQTEPSNTMGKITPEVLPTVFRFFDTQTLGRGARVNKTWRDQSQDLLKIHKFSTILRNIARGSLKSSAALNYLKTQKFAVNIPVPQEPYEIGTNTFIENLNPSLLHNLAEWLPKKDEKENYNNICKKLLELGADPNAICLVKNTSIEEGVSVNEESVFEMALRNGNEHLIFLFLELYQDNKLIFEAPDKILEAVIDDFARTTELSLSENKNIRDIFQPQAIIRGQFINIMLDSGFLPNFATMKKYFGKKIQIPTDTPYTTRDLDFLLLHLHPGEKNEKMVKELKQENYSLKKQLELAKQQLIALKQAKETGKDEEVAELPAAQL